MRKTWCLVMLAALGAWACSSSKTGFGEETPAGGNDGGVPPAGGDLDSGIFGGDVRATPEGGKAVSEVFGHSADTLYRLDPVTKGVTAVGKFSGCSGNIIDLALDEDSNLFAASSNAIHRVDRKTAVCTRIAGGQYPNSLSFVPKGTLDPNAEALVGYFVDRYVRIDTTTGVSTTIGTLGNGMASSGDVVSVKGGGTYLTATGPGCTDCLLEIDPKTGAMIKNLGSLGHSKVYGLAFWGGRAYGFDDFGELFEITFSPLSTQNIQIPSAPTDLSFWGAGSSTSVPLEFPR